MFSVKQASRTEYPMPSISFRKRIKKSLPYYVLIALPLIFLLIFKYYPM